MKRYILLLISICFLLFSTETKADYIVYVTKTGECYHIEGCSYLKSSIPISLEDAIAKGYRACSRCKPDSNLGETYTTKSSTTTLQKSTVSTVKSTNEYNAGVVRSASVGKTETKKEPMTEHEKDLITGLIIVFVVITPTVYVSLNKYEKIMLDKKEKK